MSENKRKTGKKTTAFLALAAALLASNAVSVMAAAEETSGSDFVQNPDLTDVKYTGGTPAYTKINDNVFVSIWCVFSSLMRVRTALFVVIISNAGMRPPSTDGRSC